MSTTSRTSARSCELSLGLVEGLNVEVCESGERALQRLPDITPDLVLLDVMMPGTGWPDDAATYACGSALRKHPGSIRDCEGDAAEVARFRELGAVAVIAKPFDPLQFGQQIVAIWEGLDHGRA